MMGTGYGRAMSVTTSQWPRRLMGSTISSMTSAIVVCSRSTARGVNAFDTTLRTRWCRAPSMPSKEFCTLSHNGPEVMPWTVRMYPGGM
jgi:hypothetical protein